MWTHSCRHEFQIHRTSELSYYMLSLELCCEHQTFITNFEVLKINKKFPLFQQYQFYGSNQVTEKKICLIVLEDASFKLITFFLTLCLQLGFFPEKIVLPNYQEEGRKCIFFSRETNTRDLYDTDWIRNKWRWQYCKHRTMSYRRDVIEEGRVFLTGQTVLFHKAYFQNILDKNGFFFTYIYFLLFFS